MTIQERETQKKAIMKNLKVSEEKALEILAFDEIIDKGGRTEYDLTEEKEKQAKKMANVGIKTVDAYGRARTRERKENVEKRKLMEILEQSLKNCNDVNELQVANPERVLKFQYSGKNFEVILTQKRK